MVFDYALSFITMELAYIIVVMYVLHKTNTNIGTRAEIQNFKLIQYMFVLEAAMQVLWVMDYASVVSLPVFALWMVNMVYLLAFSICMYGWLSYMSRKMAVIGNKRYTSFVLRFQSVVAVLHVLLIITSVWTRFVFYIDAEGEYIRGSLFWVNIICNYSHWLSVAALFFYSVRKADKIARSQLRKLFYISLLPALGGVLQVWSYNVPFNETSMMLSILFMFAILQDDQIKTDALTGLNNRALFEKTYLHMIEKADSDPFYIFVSDINRFKYINDTYGHLAGDSALLLVSTVLKKLTRQYPSLESFRYGGDEFVMLVQSSDISDAKVFANTINNYLVEAGREQATEFEVRFSIGYQQIRDKNVDGNKAFNEADKMLYREKSKLPDLR